MTILVLAPHPDDEVLGAGGTIARLAALGDQVHVAILTRGNPAVYDEAQISAVRAEALAAHRVLGVAGTHFCEDLPSPGLDTVPHHLVTETIRRWLTDIQPEALLIPHGGDIHMDHRAAYHAALVAARPGTSSVRRILAYETLSETEWSGPAVADAFLPNVFVDITAHLAAKQAAIREFRSQLRAFPNPRSPEGIEALARYRGSAMQLAAAEAFVLVREIAS